MGAWGFVMICSSDESSGSGGNMGAFSGTGGILEIYKFLIALANLLRIYGIFANSSKVSSDLRLLNDGFLSGKSGNACSILGIPVDPLLRYAICVLYN